MRILIEMVERLLKQILHICFAAWSKCGPYLLYSLYKMLHTFSSDIPTALAISLTALYATETPYLYQADYFSPYPRACPLRQPNVKAKY